MGGDFFAGAGALYCVIYTDVPAFPMLPSFLVAPVLALAAVRVRKEEEREQQPASSKDVHFSLQV